MKTTFGKKKSKTCAKRSIFRTWPKSLKPPVNFPPKRISRCRFARENSPRRLVADWRLRFKRSKFVGETRGKRVGLFFLDFFRFFFGLKFVFHIFCGVVSRVFGCSVFFPFIEVAFREVSQWLPGCIPGVLLCSFLVAQWFGVVLWSGSVACLECLLRWSACVPVQSKCSIAEGLSMPWAPQTNEPSFGLSQRLFSDSKRLQEDLLSLQSWRVLL